MKYLSILLLIILTGCSTSQETTSYYYTTEIQQDVEDIHDELERIRIQQEISDYIKTTETQPIEIEVIINP